MRCQRPAQPASGDSHHLNASSEHNLTPQSLRTIRSSVTFKKIASGHAFISIKPPQTDSCISKFLNSRGKSGGKPQSRQTGEGYAMSSSTKRRDVGELRNSSHAERNPWNPILDVPCQRMQNPSFRKPPPVSRLTVRTWNPAMKMIGEQYDVLKCGPCCPGSFVKKDSVSPTLSDPQITIALARSLHGPLFWPVATARTCT